MYTLLIELFLIKHFFFFLILMQKAKNNIFHGLNVTFHKVFMGNIGHRVLI